MYVIFLRDNGGQYTFATMSILTINSLSTDTIWDARSFLRAWMMTRPLDLELCLKPGEIIRCGDESDVPVWVFELSNLKESQTGEVRT